MHVASCTASILRVIRVTVPSYRTTPNITNLAETWPQEEVVPRVLQDQGYGVRAFEAPFVLGRHFVLFVRVFRGCRCCLCSASKRASAV